MFAGDRCRQVPHGEVSLGVGRLYGGSANCEENALGQPEVPEMDLFRQWADVVEHGISERGTDGWDRPEQLRVGLEEVIADGPGSRIAILLPGSAAVRPGECSG